MKEPQKTAKKSRLNLYIDEKMMVKVEREAKKLGLNATAYVRMLLIERLG